MTSLIWIAAGYFLGSLPFSVWIGKIFLRKDIRTYGDGAPGASNVARAGNIPLFVLAALMDGFKGAVPVWLAQLVSGINGWPLAIIAVSPVVGHAFTPFLKFNGGMGVAPTYGAWLGLLGWIGPVIMGVCAGLCFALQKNWIWVSLSSLAGLFIFLLAVKAQFFLAGVCMAHAAIQVSKRYRQLTMRPDLQPWVARLRGKS